MNLIYSLSIFLFSAVIRLVAPFNSKARQISKGRTRIFPDLKSKIEHDRPTVWVHCASLGEFEQGRPLIEAIKKNKPEYRILLTFFSPSGYEIRKNYELADYISYLPADTKRNATRLINLARPRMVFFIKYEFWHHFTAELKRRNIPLYLVSAIFRPNQLFFKKSPWAVWYRNILYRFQHFFVQDEQSVQLLAQLGINQATKAGDTRFDRVAEIARNGKALPVVERFKGSSKLVVVGSSWKPDEELLAPYIEINPEIKFVIAPHETKRGNIERLINLLKKPAICYTEVTEKTDMNSQVLIVDTIGILSSIYKYADVAYIGGGFGVGIHNTLEAAIFGMPILFGPNYLKFQEAVNMVNLGIAFPVSEYASLEKSLSLFLNDDETRAKISEKCIEFTKQNLGATSVILNKVFNKG
jgi:3-deoxy-D-manno-octulosonic-acid transferase